MKNTLLTLIFSVLYFFGHAQVGIGTNTPNTSAALEITSNNKGLLIPRMTEAQKNAIASPTIGLLIYQTNIASGFWFYNGASWQPYTQSNAGWNTAGDSGTTPTNNFLGTIDNQDLVIKTNNTEALRIDNSGRVGLGDSNPSNKLVITGSGESLVFQDTNQANGLVMVSDANGNGSWAAPSAPTASSDDDWRFHSGSTVNDPIYRTGNVGIGSTSLPFYLLDVQKDAGAIKGTEIGLGNDEYLIDRPSEHVFSHNVVPRVDNSISLGSSTLRWRRVFATNGTINTSDVNEKKNIKALNYSTSTLMKLKPVHYQWKKEQFGKTIVKENDKKAKIGFIAQDLLEVMPEVVKTHHWREQNGKYVKIPMQRLGVSYAEILPVVVKTTQEQQKLITKIKQQQKEALDIINELQNN